MSSHLSYRPEIDGLRAFAVIAVIIFHLDPSWLKGGFLGVDVFFVISGFLITGIIQKGVDSGSFSLVGFWMRRIRRLYPALMVVVAVSALLANYLLIRPERQNMVPQAIGAIFSFSNILLWKTTDGYWSTSSEDIPLLHTWSLSLEEQFYIFFPLFLLLIHRFLRKGLLPSLLLLTVASLALSIIWTDLDRSAAFYLLPTRMWELAIGSMLAIVQLRRPSLFRTNPRINSIASFVGLAAIACSFFLFENNESFPKATPLLSCLGTATVLAFGHQAGVAKTILTFKPLGYIGNISYSLYLWHWPVIVFARFVTPQPHTLELLIMMLALASLSYHFIENPFRRGFKGHLPALASMPAMVGLCILPIRLLDASPGLPTKLAHLESEDSLSKGEEFEATAEILQKNSGLKVAGDPDRPTIAIAGSSHARVLCPPIFDYARELRWNAATFATSGVGISYNWKTKLRKNADVINRKRLDAIISLQPSITLVAGLWSGEATYVGFADSLRENLSEIAKSSGRVIVLSQVPMHDLPDEYDESFREFLLAAYRSGEKLEIGPDPAVVQANRLVESIVQSFDNPKISFLNVYDPLLNLDGSIRFLSEGKVLYSDRHHLNDFGSAYIFEQAIKPALLDYIKEIDGQSLERSGPSLPIASATL